MITRRELVYNKPICKIVYEEQIDLLTATWIGFLPLDKTKEACEVLVNYARKNQVTKQLSDQTSLRVLSREVQQLVITKIFPALSELGTRKFATLLSQDLFAKATAENVHKMSDFKVGDMVIRSFLDRTECMQWLNE